MSKIQNSKLVFAGRRCVNERRFDGGTVREYRITNTQCRMSNFQSDYGKEFRIENEELTVKRLDGQTVFVLPKGLVNTWHGFGLREALWHIIMTYILESGGRSANVSAANK